MIDMVRCMAGGLCLCVCVCVVVSHTCTTQGVATRRKIRLVESNAKCRQLKKGTLRQLFICLRLPPLLGFSLGRSSNFVGSESRQIQSIKLLQIMVSNRTQHPPPSHTLPVYTVLWHGRGERWTREKLIGPIVHKAGSKIPIWLTVSPVCKL